MAQALDDLGAGRDLSVGLADVVQQLGQVDLGGVVVELGVAVEQLQGVEQPVGQARHAPHGHAHLLGPLGQLDGRDPLVAHLDEALGLAVDDRERRAELVRSHRDEIALHVGEALLVLEALGEHRRLLLQPALAVRQLDRIVAKDDDRPRHLADLVAPLGAERGDVGLVGGQRAHARGQVQYRPQDAAADVAHEQHAHEHERPIARTIIERVRRKMSSARLLASRAPLTVRSVSTPSASLAEA